MEESVRTFNEQLSYQPEIINQDKLGKYKNYIVCGMGGSHLQAGVLKQWKPGINLYVHRDYDLPPFDEAFMRDTLVIASSYSGNTEETISALEMAYSKGFDVAVITTGGMLLEKAQEWNLPHIVMPNTGIQPRSALGFASIALAQMIGEPDFLVDMQQLASDLDPSSLEVQGKEIAQTLAGKLPVIYASTRNLPIAYNWKIKMNETGKVPAFYNIFPEMNHNEMQGFGNGVAHEQLHAIFLQDRDDASQIQKRMQICAGLYETKGYGVTSLELFGDSVLHKLFSSLLLADWVAIGLAEAQNVDPESVPMIEEFKKQL